MFTPSEISRHPSPDFELLTSMTQPAVPKFQLGLSAWSQEELLQWVITDSRAYGTLLGSGAIGDSGKPYSPLSSCPNDVDVTSCLSSWLLRSLGYCWPCKWNDFCCTQSFVQALQLLYLLFTHVPSASQAPEPSSACIHCFAFQRLYEGVLEQHCPHHRLWPFHRPTNPSQTNVCVFQFLDFMLK